MCITIRIILHVLHQRPCQKNDSHVNENHIKSLQEIIINIFQLYLFYSIQSGQLKLKAPAIFECNTNEPIRTRHLLSEKLCCCSSQNTPAEGSNASSERHSDLLALFNRRYLKYLAVKVNVVCFNVTPSVF